MKNSLFIIGILISLVPHFLLSQSNVGVGTWSPESKLHIKGTADNSQLIINANSTQSNSQLLIQMDVKKVKGLLPAPDFQ